MELDGHSLEASLGADAWRKGPEQQPVAERKIVIK